MQSKKGAFNPGALILTVIGIVIIVLVMTAVLPSVQESVDETEAGGSLENLSSGSKALWALMPFLLIIVGLLAVVGGGIMAAKGKG